MKVKNPRKACECSCSPGRDTDFKDLLSRFERNNGCEGPTDRRHRRMAAIDNIEQPRRSRPGAAACGLGFAKVLSHNSIASPLTSRTSFVCVP